MLTRMFFNATEAAGAETEAEYEIHQTLRSYRRAGRTSLLISHRLGALRDADTLEQGTHDELMATGGIYGGSPMILYGTVAAVALVAVAAAIAWMRGHLRVVTVYGESMRPTLAPGDRVLVRRTPLSRVHTGDIVVVDDAAMHLDSAPTWAPYGAEPLPAGAEGLPDGFDVVLDGFDAIDSQTRWLIKRAIAVPGDPVPASVAPVLSVPAGAPVRAGALVVIGDNRGASFDSRHFGYVTAEQLLGVVLRPMSVAGGR